MPAIVAAGLAASYGASPVWSEATFEIPAGSFTAVLGPNGAGKSTLFRLILGLQSPSAGRLRVLGAAPRRGNPAIGYVPQSSAFDRDQSVRGLDYVSLGLDGHRWGPRITGRAAARAAVTAAVEAVGAEAFAGRPMGRLSGGEQQRLMLAQAMVGGPRLLLLDEPLANLDVRAQGTTAALVADLARSRALTVVLIAHDVNPLLPHLDQVVFLAHGRVAAGPPAEVITTEALSRVYSAPIEVIRDRRGRVFVVGLEEEVRHPHSA